MTIKRESTLHYRGFCCKTEGKTELFYKR
uniref:Uncharacterized protein n=1 Tax=Arundo donax TaxID=35708 RepID=A0A0A9C4X7_ARUDO